MTTRDNTDPSTPRKKRVLFVCVENANRSQMAEAFARLHGGDAVEALSAGSRPSGVINPNNVTSANTVQSTQVADARMEYRGSGFIDESNTMGWLQRFFVAILPF